MNFKDFLFLDKMITPTVIVGLYWIGIVAVIVTGLYMLFAQSFWGGLFTIIGGVIFVRLWSELIILAFKIYGCLKQIAEKQ